MLVAPLFKSLVSTNVSIAKGLGYEYDNDYKFVICQGGGDSAKTVSILQMLAWAAALEKNTKILIAADSVPNLKDGAMNAFESYVLKDFSNYILKHNATDHVYYFNNGSKIKFKSFMGEKKARGAEWDYVFFNEANLFNYDLFWQIQRKTRKQVYLDYNPTSEFWAHYQIIKGGEKQYEKKWVQFIVDHRHNPFLTEDQHNDYETISDPELFRVYARGETGKITGLIFNHFKKITPEMQVPQFDRVIWGIDYGYTNDPTAIVKVGIKGRQRWFYQCSYTPGMSALQIKNLLDINGRKPNEILYSVIDKEMILQLRKLGVQVQQAKKGPGSKIAGISKVKEYECFYQGEDFEKELAHYKYVTATDLLTGKTILTNEPMDGNDHLCDASMYAVYTDSFIIREGY